MRYFIVLFPFIWICIGQSLYTQQTYIKGCIKELYKDSSAWKSRNEHIN